MSDDDQLQMLGMALRLQSDAVITFLDFLNRYFTGEYTRDSLEHVAKEREVYFTESTSDYDLWLGCITSMRIDLRNMADTIRDKIKIKE